MLHFSKSEEMKTFLQVSFSLSVWPDWRQWLSEVAKDNMFLFIQISIIWADEFLLWSMLISQALAYSTTKKIVIDFPLRYTKKKIDSAIEYISVSESLVKH